MSMKQGFGLTEVMVALVLVTIIMTAVTRLYMTSTRMGAYADNLTYAATVAHSHLQILKAKAYDHGDLKPGWHTATDNPVANGGHYYALGWLVSPRPGGKAITVYAAWNDHTGSPSATSPEDITAGAYTECQGFVEPLE